VKRTLRFICVLTAAALGSALAGCDVQGTLEDLAREVKVQPPPGQSASPAGAPEAAPARPGETIRIASFNIQVFGTSKSAKPQVMNILAQVARRFDVLAIQEIRAKDQTVVPRFVDLINAEGARYQYQIGPRLGRTSSKEQYAFIYDTSRIEIQPRSVYTASDPDDFLHREPLVARFRVRGVPPSEAFSFKLINIHTDPDETDIELDELARVFVAVQRDGSGEDDCILLGDLNVDEYHLGQLGRLPNIAWAISGQKTNTRRTKSYDNLVFDRRATTEYTGYSGVLDLMTEFRLTMDQALEVSDHLPVWAEFRAREDAPGAVVASMPGEGPR
jgi:endonuclease/exonuclease/phosphatase family metal-dependent hydrolase